MKISLFLLSHFMLSYALGKVQKLECIENQKITIPSDAKNHRAEVASYCYSLKPYILVSQNCMKKSCKAFRYSNIAAQPEESSFGTPGSKSCRKAGGTPQTIFFETKNGKEKFNRCYFNDDKSFVDIGTFFSFQTMVELDATEYESDKPN